MVCECCDIVIGPSVQSRHYSACWKEGTPLDFAAILFSRTSPYGDLIVLGHCSRTQPDHNFTAVPNTRKTSFS
jgi:hypothetical protein